MPDTKPNVLYVWFNPFTYHLAGGSGAGPACHCRHRKGTVSRGPVPPVGASFCDRCARTQQDAARG